MSIFTYLAAMLSKLLTGEGQLALILKNQEKIMATLQDVQNRLDSLTAAVAPFPGSLASISAAITNVAGDIQALKDQIGQAPVGITPEEADGVVSQLDGIVTNLTAAANGLQQVSTDLQAVADAQ